MQPHVKMSPLSEDGRQEREEHGSSMIPLSCQINPGYPIMKFLIN